jgi:hypothetical protein
MSAKRASTIKPVVAFGFRGMNNLPAEPARLLDEKRKITPRIALNVTVTQEGVLQKRKGITPVKNLTGLHSLAGEEIGLSIMLGVAQGILYQIEGDQATLITTIGGPKARMSYAEVDGKIYISGPFWKGILDLSSMSVSNWGLDLPPAPDIIMVAGDLAPGKYSLCYTNVKGNRISGNGGITQVAWQETAQGIRLNNLPDGALCWITQPNGGKLFLANVVNGEIVGQVPKIKPIPTLAVRPPPVFSHFCHAFGRIWGAHGKRLYYSSPFQYEWFRPGNYLPFLETLVLVAPVNEGLFVSSLKTTWFLAGTEPRKMAVSSIGDGAIPGTLTYAQVRGAITALDGLLRPEGPRMPLPIWAAPNGWVVGTHAGHLTHLTVDRLRVVPRAKGSSVYYLKKGIPQVITSFYGAPVDEVDPEVQEIFDQGQLF